MKVYSIFGFLTTCLYTQNVGIGTTQPIWNLTVSVPTLHTVSNAASAGIGIVSPMVEGDNTFGIIAMHWVNRSLPYAYRLWLADPDGGYGVEPNALELWEYPNSGPCCRPRLRIQPTRNQTYTRQPVTITSNHRIEAYGFIFISDSALKERVGASPYGLSTLMRLRPVTYRWTHEEGHKARHIGFIAQEVADVLPEAFYFTERGLSGISPMAITAVIAKSIQELAEKVEHLEKWCDKQKASNQ
ncbi:MAG: tail fiber domain-containing protein [Bacteroidia bacterium]|nr:tail fiber domain-containing protein [Bacteroidia bacterium]